jgi:exopolysaccharide biosynthesis polyprenyl glycosylphosphotransferase
VRTEQSPTRRMARLDGLVVDRIRDSAELTEAIADLPPAPAQLHAVQEPETPPAAARDRDAVYRHALVASDLLCAAIAFLVSAALVNGGPLKLTAILVLPLVTAVSAAMGGYGRDDLLLRKTTLDEAPRLFQVATLCALVISVGGSLVVAGGLDAGSVLAFWVMLLASSLLLRGAARNIARRRTGVERCVVIGDLAVADDLRSKLAGSQVRAEVVGVVPIGEGIGLVDLWDISDLREVLDDFEPDRVILASHFARADELARLVRAINSFRIKLSVMPQAGETAGSAEVVDDVRGVPLVGVRTFHARTSSALVKRAWDLTGAALGLLFTFPLLAVVAVAIKLDSRGPAFFWQTRVGRHGKTFRMVKFRTMEDGADARKAQLRGLNEADGLFKIAHDPRVTRAGRFLRRTSLDELPQLWNVFKGEMSLVGPRPLVVEEDQQVEGWHRRRLDLSPGMTGHWQILGASRIPLHEMVEIDYLYVANWSVWSDVKILLRTMSCVIGRSGL